jgi:hypothetical protein
LVSAVLIGQREAVYQNLEGMTKADAPESWEGQLIKEPGLHCDPDRGVTGLVAQFLSHFIAYIEVIMINF